MVDIVAEFFLIVGIEPVPPLNLAELIPYLLRVFVAVALVSGTFSVVGRVSEALSGFRG